MAAMPACATLRLSIFHFSCSVRAVAAVHKVMENRDEEPGGVVGHIL